jgi:hypothetical protein
MAEFEESIREGSREPTLEEKVEALDILLRTNPRGISSGLEVPDAYTLLREMEDEMGRRVSEAEEQEWLGYCAGILRVAKDRFLTGACRSSGVALVDLGQDEVLL